MPSAARRITGLQQLNMNMEENQKIKLSIKQLYGDGTYLVKLADAGNNNGKTEQEQKIGSINASSQEPLSGTETQPLGVKSIDRRPTSRLEIEEEVYVASDLTPLFALKNDEPVKIVGRRNNQLCIKNKECYEKSKELNEYIQNLDKSGLKLTSPKTGQLVLAKKDDAPAGALWYRAAVVSKESSATLEISYVDLKGEDTLGVKSLRNVDEHLASYPVLMTLTPPLSMLDSALEYVDQLIKDKTKMRLAVSGDDVDFRFEDGTLLSKKILNLNKKSSKELPKLVPVETVAPQSAEAPIPAADEACEPPETQKSVTEPTPKPTNPKSLNEQEAESPEHFTFNLMDWTRLSPGTHHVLFYTINDITDITVVSMEDKLIDQLAQVSAIQVEDDTPYEPMECEMCLVLYKSEAEEESSWYRAFITEINGENYAATCVDFGNIVVVTKREIRKYPQ
ncbi:unnamed protein product [Acanthoscelides obtectus]|uniref:Tudor domain-containing protein n=1 Tax=Acanthoscelides obtectus TaxID=200917 RepID=A0A9P0LFY2_ACAOB|nr:unnamed protein product [Acanthoscelides obtectus]CAK1659576.1 hypothetical protein AOBTE_LOCUS21551 [Acanthoscelides obtectus]